MSWHSSDRPAYNTFPSNLNVGSSSSSNDYEYGISSAPRSSSSSVPGFGYQGAPKTDATWRVQQEPHARREREEHRQSPPRWEAWRSATKPNTVAGEDWRERYKDEVALSRGGSDGREERRGSARHERSRSRSLEKAERHRRDRDSRSPTRRSSNNGSPTKRQAVKKEAAAADTTEENDATKSTKSGNSAAVIRSAESMGKSKEESGDTSAERDTTVEEGEVHEEGDEGKGDQFHKGIKNADETVVVLKQWKFEDIHFFGGRGRGRGGSRGGRGSFRGRGGGFGPRDEPPEPLHGGYAGRGHGRGEHNDDYDGPHKPKGGDDSWVKQYFSQVKRIKTELAEDGDYRPVAAPAPKQAAANQIGDKKPTLFESSANRRIAEWEKFKSERGDDPLQFLETLSDDDEKETWRQILDLVGDTAKATSVAPEVEVIPPPPKRSLLGQAPPDAPRVRPLSPDLGGFFREELPSVKPRLGLVSREADSFAPHERSDSPPRQSEREAPAVQHYERPHHHTARQTTPPPAQPPRYDNDAPPYRRDDVPPYAGGGRGGGRPAAALLPPPRQHHREPLRDAPPMQDRYYDSRADMYGGRGRSPPPPRGDRYGAGDGYPGRPYDDQPRRHDMGPEPYGRGGPPDPYMRGAPGPDPYGAQRPPSPPYRGGPGPGGPNPYGAQRPPSPPYRGGGPGGPEGPPYRGGGPGGPPEGPPYRGGGPGGPPEGPPHGAYGRGGPPMPPGGPGPGGRGEPPHDFYDRTSRGPYGPPGLGAPPYDGPPRDDYGYHQRPGPMDSRRDPYPPPFPEGDPYGRPRDSYAPPPIRDPDWRFEKPGGMRGGEPYGGGPPPMRREPEPYRGGPPPPDYGGRMRGRTPPPYWDERLY